MYRKITAHPVMDGFQSAKIMLGLAGIISGLTPAVRGISPAKKPDPALVSLR